MNKGFLKILIYGYNYAPEPTGIGKYSGEMAQWLKDKGHEVEVITALPHYPAWKIDEAYQGKGFLREVIKGIHIFRTPLYLPPSQQRTALKRMLVDTSFTANSLRWWLPLAITKQFDVVIAICPSVQSGIFPYLYRILRGVPWVFHIQDLQVDAAYRLGLIKNKLAVTLLQSLELFLLKRASLVSTITESMRHRVLEKGLEEKQTILFPNWADITFVTPGPRLNKLRKDMGLKAEQTVLLYSGSMGEKQGLELIIAAAERLQKEGVEQIVFVLVGEGGTRHLLEEQARLRSLNNIRFFNLFPWEDVPALLAVGDIHLVVQKREAADLVMPSKLTNILAAGRPSIATAEEGTTLHQVLSDYQVGVAVPPDDIEAFVGAIKMLVASPEMMRRYGEQARAYAERFLDKETILGEFEENLIKLTRVVG